MATLVKLKKIVLCRNCKLRRYPTNGDALCKSFRLRRYYNRGRSLYELLIDFNINNGRPLQEPLGFAIILQKGGRPSQELLVGHYQKRPNLVERWPAGFAWPLTGSPVRLRRNYGRVRGRRGERVGVAPDRGSRTVAAKRIDRNRGLINRCLG